MVNNITMKFNELQKDLSVDDVSVHWMGESVRLHIGNKTLTTFSSENVVDKIRTWCVKNTYRCSAVSGGRVWL
jgi:hypothetical protein